MKTSKIICLILLITMISVAYVWQQTEIVKLAYNKDKRAKFHRELSDKNMALSYNVLMRESSVSLNKSLDIFDKDYEMPHFSQIVDLRNSKSQNGLGLFSKETPQLNKSNFFLSLFSLKSQAEAQTK